MSKGSMIRVNKSNPCPICDKLDWCLVAPDKTAAICARIEHGAVKRCGESGWLHILNDRQKSDKDRIRRISVPVKESPAPDFSSLAEKCRGNLNGALNSSQPTLDPPKRSGVRIVSKPSLAVRHCSTPPLPHPLLRP